MDFRITCSMINFTHKSCCADGDKALEISQRMKTKCQIVDSSELVILLSVRLGTKKVPSIKLEDLNDFPKFNQAEMIERIFFGSYYIERSKSYLADIIRNDFCCVINNKVLDSIDLDKKCKKNLSVKIVNSKIIGLEMLSRHKRSLKSSLSEKSLKNYRVNYKVFIQYSQNTVEGKIVL